MNAAPAAEHPVLLRPSTRDAGTQTAMWAGFDLWCRSCVTVVPSIADAEEEEEEVDPFSVH